eukprot:3158133-Rhodomonas_salina.2
MVAMSIVTSPFASRCPQRGGRAGAAICHPPDRQPKPQVTPPLPHAASNSTLMRSGGKDTEAIMR